MNEHVAINIREVLDYALENNGKINDSIRLPYFKMVDEFYAAEEDHNVWNKAGKFLPMGDSLYDFIENSYNYGLFPSDYHYDYLKDLKNKLQTDTLSRKDAIVWTKIDLMLTDGFLRIIQDLKHGRLGPDSLYPKTEAFLSNDFSIKTLKEVIYNRKLVPVLNDMEPNNKAYVAMRMALPDFLDSIDKTPYTYIEYPWKDSLEMLKGLQQRLEEENFSDGTVSFEDSAKFSRIIKKAQRKKGLTVDGKVTGSLVKRLNTRWTDYFKKIALNLDRYKQMPSPMPEKYIWVNLPGFYLRVFEKDSMILESKVIVGKPTTPTPLLSSTLSNMVTYPQWTIPASIIKKEVLPGLKKDPGYLSRKGYMLVNDKGDEVDAYKVKWSKYHDDIPSKVVQGSGDENALGVFKFNFYSPFDVYLHDTNQRYLFKNKTRALSHGCVRVQDWEKLESYITYNDSLSSTKSRPVSYNSDSIKTWLEKKMKKIIYVRTRLPIYIRYITCEANPAGSIVFYDDIYGLDKASENKLGKKG